MFYNLIITKQENQDSIEYERRGGRNDCMMVFPLISEASIIEIVLVTPMKDKILRRCLK